MKSKILWCTLIITLFLTACEPKFAEGSRWNMCGSTVNCDQTFPVTVLKRNGETLTFQMPAGTLDVSESQIEIVSTEKRTIKIIEKRSKG